MKITFSNLGTIKKTTLDLRPLTVIIGPNNTNKTYIAYSIYGLMLNLFDNAGRFIFDLNEAKESDVYASLKIDNNFFQTYVINCREIVDEFIDNLDSYFQDSSQKLFSKTNYKILISEKDVKEAFDKVLDGGLRRKTEFKDKNLIIYYDKSDIAEYENRRSLIHISVLAELIVELRYSLFSRPFVLPAERNALILNYQLMENRRLKEFKDIKRLSAREINQQLSLFSNPNLVQFPQPIEDFLEFLNSLESEIKQTNNKNFYKIASSIEEDIQQKNLTKLNLASKEIKIEVKKGLNIDIYNASSSIKQLAPLLMFLRYRASADDLLIIDEPEMNLHPESQAKLLEVLGMLVNAGVNVLLTTHSPYFMSHLNNLISGDMTDEKTRKAQAKSLYLKDERAFLKPEDVSAYEMRQSKTGNTRLHDLHDKDYGIRWDTLSDVSSDIQQKYFEIYEKKQETSKEDEN